jgi:ubiquinone/menaquinone biosynthesis C-methylase UbiE
VTIEATDLRTARKIAEGQQTLEAEQVARYAFVAQFIQGRRVLDVGCGNGWGTAMLLAAGASSVCGIDSDAAAVAAARERLPDAQFVQGDPVSLPWNPESFEVVVCFDTIEHLGEVDRTLDEMVRVLTEDGLLVVSSANPRVPATPELANALAPEELRELVRRRLPIAALWRQHSQIASVMISDGGLPAEETRDVRARALAPLEPGSDPFSVVVAGRAELPWLPPFVCAAPSAALLALEQLTSEATAEREQIGAEREGLRRELDTATARIESLERQTDTLRRQREHASALLLESEQQLATALGAAEAGLRERDGAEALEEEVARLRHENNVFATSKSWRLTAPLRAIRRAVAPRQ